MKPITGIIKSVNNGEVSVRMCDGRTVKHKTGRRFLYGQKVIVLIDLHYAKVRGLIYPSELNLEDEKLPECPETTEELKDPADEGDLGGEDLSSPLPDGRFEELSDSDSEEEQEFSFPLPDGRFEEFFLGVDDYLEKPVVGGRRDLAKD